MSYVLCALLCALFVGFSSSTPTFAPSSAPLSIAFNSTLTLQYVASSSWIPAEMNAVDEGLATILSVSSDHFRVVSESSIEDGPTNYELVVTVEVTVSVADFAGASDYSASQLYTMVTQLLSASVGSTHTLVNAIHSAATTYSASNLQSITKIDMSNSDFTSSNAETASSDNNDDFSTQDTFGVVVAGVLLITVCWALCFFYIFCIWCKPKQRGDPETSEKIKMSDNPSRAETAPRADSTDVVKVTNGIELSEV